MSEIIVEEKFTGIEDQDYTRLSKNVLIGLKKRFDKVKMDFDDDGNAIYTCRVKTSLLNPVVSLKLKLTAENYKENITVVELNGKTKTNGWFWFTFFLGFAGGIIFVALILLWHMQKKKSIETLKEVLESVSLKQ